MLVEAVLISIFKDIIKHVPVKELFKEFDAIYSISQALKNPTNPTFDFLSPLIKKVFFQLGANTGSGSIWIRWPAAVQRRVRNLFYPPGPFRKLTVRNWLSAPQTLTDFTALATQRLRRSDDPEANARLIESYKTATCEYEEKDKDKDKAQEAIWLALAVINACMAPGVEPASMALLQSVGSDVAQIKGDVKDLKQWSEPRLATRSIQPIKDWDPANYERFLYTSAITKVIGRDKEFKALQEFCPENPTDAPGNFRWWLLTGAGGAGKTRLAMEMVLQRRAQGWFADFLDKDKIQKTLEIMGETWFPHKPTFLVIDYAAGAASDIRTALKDMQLRSAKFGLPVRLLLIEREARGPWYETLLGTADKDRLAIEKCRHLQSDALDLTPLTIPDAWALLQAAYKAYAAKPGAKPSGRLPTEKEAVPLLKGLEANRRPLYALLLADALLHGDR